MLKEEVMRGLMVLLGTPGSLPFCPGGTLHLEYPSYSKRPLAGGMWLMSDVVIFFRPVLKFGDSLLSCSLSFWFPLQTFVESKRQQYSILPRNLHVGKQVNAFTTCVVHGVMRTLSASGGMIVSQQGTHAFQIAQHLGLK